MHICVFVHSVMSDSLDYSPPGSSVHGIFQNKNTGVGCHFLLQGIFLTKGSNPNVLCLLHWQADSLPPELPGRLPITTNGSG